MARTGKPRVLTIHDLSLQFDKMVWPKAPSVRKQAHMIMEAVKPDIVTLSVVVN